MFVDVASKRRFVGLQRLGRDGLRRLEVSVGSRRGPLVAHVPADLTLVPAVVVTIVEGEEPVEQLLGSGRKEVKSNQPPNP